MQGLLQRGFEKGGRAWAQPQTQQRKKELMDKEQDGASLDQKLLRGNISGKGNSG